MRHRGEPGNGIALAFTAVIGGIMYLLRIPQAIYSATDSAFLVALPIVIPALICDILFVRRIWDKLEDKLGYGKARAIDIGLVVLFFGSLMLVGRLIVKANTSA